MMNVEASVVQIADIDGFAAKYIEPPPRGRADLTLLVTKTTKVLHRRAKIGRSDDCV